MKKLRTKIYLLIFFLSMGLLVFVTVNTSESNDYEKEVNRSIAVSTGEARITVHEKKKYFTGTVEGLTSAIISSRYADRVSAIYVENGQKVQKGQPLLKTDDTELKNRLIIAKNALRKTEVNFNNAKATYNRNRLIFDKGAVSRQNLDTLSAKLEVCRADLDDARSNLNIAKKKLQDSVVLSSVDGVVANKNVTLGQMVSQGSELMRIEHIDAVYVTVQIPQQEISCVNIGTSAKVTVDAYKGHVFKGEIAVINPVAGRDSRLFEVKIRIDNLDFLLKPGMFAEASILSKDAKRQVLTIPRQALLSHKGINYVYVMENDGKAHKTVVEIGELIDDRLEITSGLKEGQRIITDNLDMLMEGSKVSTYEDIKL